MTNYTHNLIQLHNYIFQSTFLGASAGADLRESIVARNTSHITSSATGVTSLYIPPQQRSREGPARTALHRKCVQYGAASCVQRPIDSQYREDVFLQYVLPTHCCVALFLTGVMAGASVPPPVIQGSDKVRKVLGFTVNRSCEACWRAKKRCHSDGINPCRYAHDDGAFRLKHTTPLVRQVVTLCPVSYLQVLHDT